MLTSLTKQELIDIYGSIQKLAEQMEVTRQNIYLQIDKEGICSHDLTCKILGHALLCGTIRNFPERFWSYQNE